MFYRIMRFIVYPFIRIFMRVEYHGKENVPKNKGYILAANHTSIADMFAIAVPVKAQICYMAKAELFKFKPVVWLFKALGTFAVKRGKGDTEAIDKACSIIENGKVLGIFPEGTRSKTGEPGKAKAGVALIAMQTKADILPISVRYSKGTFKLFSKVTVRVGELIPFEEPAEEEGQRAAIRRISTSVMDKIKELWETE
ncbi:MAG: 1-acyl-sn-glycerol-3-phosphate acyltransferase [Clostridia bacterium]|nr:1-acyl-sn-glycerol-3-phosphate acyltransferase [Clostridia bacterium]